MFKLFGMGTLLVVAVLQAALAGELEGGAFSGLAQDFTGGGPSNQFPRIKGNYSGLLMPTNGFVSQYSGSFRLWVDSDRDFDGRLDLGQETVWLGGRFNRQGQAAVRVYRNYWDDCFCFYERRLLWEVKLNLVPGTDEVEGTVDNLRHGWTTQLAGHRTIETRDEPAPFAGRYTLRLPTGAFPEIAPPGEGYASVTVTSGGEVRSIGALADGTVFSRSSTVSSNGSWPFFLPLNGGRGSVIGWLQFGTPSTNEVSGELQWVRPQRNDSRLYPLGYSGTLSATGSRYQASGTDEVPLSWTDGSIQFSGGNLVSPAVNQVTWLPGGALISNGGDLAGLTYRLNRSTGVFRGKFVRPENGRSVSYAGVLDQRSDLGAGYFLGSDQGGLVRLEAAP